MNNKKKHHFIPASYLAGFTKNWRRRSNFWAVPKGNSKPYGTNPLDACAERNYYCLGNNPEDPLIIENWYGENIETEVGRVLELIKGGATSLNKNDENSLIYLAAMLYLRNPSYRESISRPFKAVSRKIILGLANSKQLFESHFNKALKEGFIEQIPDFEKFREMVKNPIFDISISKDYLICSEMGMFFEIVSFLQNRQWFLFHIPENESYELITSDQPFILSHKSVEIYGLTSPDTDVLIPVNKKCLLLGLLKEEKFSSVADKYMIGIANRKIAVNSRNVFFTSKELVVFSDGNKVWYSNIFAT